MRGEKGLTLVELMVTLVITSIMGLALVGFLRSQHQTVTRQNDGVLATQNARAAVDMLARELRNAGYDPRGSGTAALTAMEADSVAWTADLDEDNGVTSFDPVADTYEEVAYWHDDFGTPRSHGCVNLAPNDAAWLFAWTKPDVPEAWHGALSLRKGTLVYIHP